nr:hypothetical protein [Providencia alcalifaciens]
MKREKNLKSEKYHWWPQTISKHWENQNGFINRINAKGENTEIKPKSLAVIKNGHIIKLSDTQKRGRVLSKISNLFVIMQITTPIQ